MKILLIAQSMESTNGWGTFAKNTLQGLNTNNHQVYIITQNSGLPAPITLIRSVLARIKAGWYIAKIVKKEKPDIIHILVEPYVLAMPTACIFGLHTPFVMNLHGTYGVVQCKNKWSKRVMKKAIKQCSGFFVCSKFTNNQVGDAIKENFGLNILDHVQKNTVFMRLAVKLPEVINEKQNENHQIIFVGEVKPRKGVMEIVNGFIKYKEKFDKRAILNIVGKLNEKSTYICEMLEIIKNNNMEDSIIFHNKVSNEKLEKLYEQANVFIMLSKKDGDNFEGYGLVFIEANSRGIPTISSKESGGAETILDGKTGYIVDHNSTEQISDALKKILIEKNIDSKECIAWANKHNILQQTETCEHMYEEVLHRNNI